MSHSTHLVFKSPLHQMAASTCTELWIDSCAPAELNYAIEHGAVGATSNPVIVGEVLKKELPAYAPRIDALIKENSEASEDEIAWKIIEEMAGKAAALLHPIFVRDNKKRGRLSVQTSPKFWNNAAAMIKQAEHLNALAPNIQIKIPVTKAGIAAIEEVTARGISVNATVSFAVAQTIAVAEAVERGLARRKADGKSSEDMTPVCTIMVGRVDDWMRVVAERDGITGDPGATNWAGVAVMKKAYGIFLKCGFKTRLLAAAYRCHMHWSEFVGGDVILSIPFKYQKLFNSSGIKVESRMDTPVDAKILAELMRFEEFRRSYNEEGLKVEEFDTFGPTRRTLRQFIAGYQDLVGLIRERMIPNPDVK